VGSPVALLSSTAPVHEGIATIMTAATSATIPPANTVMRRCVLRVPGGRSERVGGRAAEAGIAADGLGVAGAPGGGVAPSCRGTEATSDGTTVRGARGSPG
jgi:hypothetical protein